MIQSVAVRGAPFGVQGNEKGTDQVREFLAFKLGTEEYGIDILKVQEIRGYEAATRMLNAPRSVLGVRNLRGAIVPIMDLRIHLDMPRIGYDSHTVTIVLNIGERIVGIVVDGVSDVVALQDAQIKQAPEFTTTLSTREVIGIATIEQGDRQRMLILLDSAQLVASIWCVNDSVAEIPSGSAEQSTGIEQERHW
jgi:purine-binding chemotaxis protein CheW